MCSPLYKQRFPVPHLDFVAAGLAASKIRKALSEAGYDSELIRSASIAAYEAEMNIVIHGGGGTMELVADHRKIVITAVDSGPGISDVTIAMEEGFSTAGDEIRKMGFGAGMGLPNIKRCVSALAIESSPGEGTSLRMTLELGR